MQNQICCFISNMQQGEQSFFLESIYTPFFRLLAYCVFWVKQTFLLKFVEFTHCNYAHRRNLCAILLLTKNVCVFIRFKVNENLTKCSIYFTPFCRFSLSTSSDVELDGSKHFTEDIFFFYFQICICRRKSLFEKTVKFVTVIFLALKQIFLFLPKNLNIPTFLAVLSFPDFLFSDFGIISAV